MNCHEMYTAFKVCAADRAHYQMLKHLAFNILKVHEKIPPLRFYLVPTGFLFNTGPTLLMIISRRLHHGGRTFSHGHVSPFEASC